MKINQLFENVIPTYKGNIKVPAKWTDLSKLPKKYPGYTPGCHLTGDFSCSDCTSLTSLQGAPSSVDGDFSCTDCTSLKRILKFLLIKNIKNIICNKPEKLKKAIEIINQHYRQDGSGDLLDCKADLIETGLSEYAKL
jgi:hypothetical protein